MIVTTGSNLQEGGDRFGGVQVCFHEPAGGDFGQPTPERGRGLLTISSVGVENVLAAPDEATWFLSLGDGCTKALGDDEFALTGNGPGTGASYGLEPGTYEASIVAEPRTSGEFPTCSGPSIVGSAPITVTADETVLLFLYGLNDGDLRALALPLDR